VIAAPESCPITSVHASDIWLRIQSLHTIQ